MKYTTKYLIINYLKHGHFSEWTQIWEYHKKDLLAQSENWQELIENLKLPLFVIGDFNQTRYNNKGYGTNEVRDILSEILQKLDLTCVTEFDFSIEHLTADPKNGKIRNNIDHICISSSLLTKMKSFQVGAWNHFTEEGKYMSDHNGVCFEFVL